ncbi:hypothetical protein JYB87_12730 [Shewanella avicenniae]|uniref:DUF5348 domain-containing protein n=1 Tax=Shewanella avicenniae TaxID=2814294 RepID=A0ABX7QMX5_9GAMM|nr:hypothetical protein [Shewanella avicenniae]QSX32614.1 hypothetical protein JYB87_12730 [Shewanella avicenniae]
MFKDLKQQYKNAKVLIRKLRAGDFTFEGFYEYEWSEKFTCYTATDGTTELWVANGISFFGVRDKPWELGNFRYWVWFAGRVNHQRRTLEKVKRRRPSELK